MKVYDCILLFLKVKCPLFVQVVFWALSSIMFWSHGSRALGRAAGPQLREERPAFHHSKSWRVPWAPVLCLPQNSTVAAHMVCSCCKFLPPP